MSAIRILHFVVLGDALWKRTDYADTLMRGPRIVVQARGSYCHRPGMDVWADQNGTNPSVTRFSWASPGTVGRSLHIWLGVQVVA